MKSIFHFDNYHLMKIKMKTRGCKLKHSAGRKLQSSAVPGKKHRLPYNTSECREKKSYKPLE